MRTVALCTRLGLQSSRPILHNTLRRFYLLVNTASPTTAPPLLPRLSPLLRSTFAVSGYTKAPLCSVCSPYLCEVCQVSCNHIQQAARCSPSNSGIWSSAAGWANQQKFSQTLLRRYAAAAGNRSKTTPSSYKIAIPTIDRSHTLGQRTLSALEATGVDTSSRVDLFVASEQEADKYFKALTPGTYANIVIGKLGIGKQRDFILAHYGPGANIVMLDDDIRWFVQKHDGPVNMHRVIQKGFELSHQHDCYMWGINNSSNNFYLKLTYSLGWCYFQGPFMAFRVRDSVRLHPKFHSTLEDAQYSLMHCEMDGKLLRLNGIGVKARPYGKEPGGLQTVMTSPERQHSDATNKEYLLQRYGRFIRTWPDSKPHPALRKSPEHEVHPLASLD